MRERRITYIRKIVEDDQEKMAEEEQAEIQEDDRAEAGEGDPVELQEDDRAE